MSDVTDRIKAHFQALGTREIPVPEWETTLYTTPVTLAERHRIYAGVRSENDYEVLAKILIAKARDKDGRPMFTLEDRAVLLQKADSAVLIRVAAEIMNNAASPPGAELKN
jgi:small-conductance mechanosensitive channel